MGRRFAPLGLDEVERAELTSLASRRSTAQALALRARIVLARAEGEQSKVVAARLAIDPDTVSKWRRRFAEHRFEGLWDEPPCLSTAGRGLPLIHHGTGTRVRPPRLGQVPEPIGNRRN